MNRFLKIKIASLLIFLATTAVACDQEGKLPYISTPAPVSDNYTIYVVKPGDTASKIADQFHLSIEELINLNKGRYQDIARDPSSIQPGWQLLVPNRALAAAYATQTAEALPPRVDSIQTAQAIVDSLNAARAGRGLGKLIPAPTLTRIANDRSADLIARNYFAHTDPQTGQEPLLRYLQANQYAYQYAGENLAEMKNEAAWVLPPFAVAARYTRAALANEFVRGWLNSPEHRLNIFNGNYRRTGVGVAVSDDGRRIVATQVFSN